MKWVALTALISCLASIWIAVAEAGWYSGNPRTSGQAALIAVLATAVAALAGTLFYVASQLHEKEMEARRE